MAHYNRNNRSIDFQNPGQHQLAIQAYYEVTQLLPSYANAYKNRGAFYKGLGQLDLAVNDYSEAFLLDFENALAFGNRALAHALLGQRQYAHKNLSVAVGPGFDSPSLKRNIKELIEELTKE